jgi:hypothetical protein
MINTYLPYPSFELSAEVLDNKRLVTQRLHAFKLIKTIVEGEGPLTAHPASHMWGRNPAALMRYHDVIVNHISLRFMRPGGFRFDQKAYTMPDWFGDLEFHSRHKASLLAQDEAHYRKFDWLERPQICYLWPTYH